MDYKIIVNRKAVKKIEKAYLYYEGISDGLGERFLEQLQRAFNSLSLYPTNFGFIDEKKILRDRLLKIFPYSVIYKIDGDSVIIVTLHNCYQDPVKRYK